jgi:hypothetical protein
MSEFYTLTANTLKKVNIRKHVILRQLFSFLLKSLAFIHLHQSRAVHHAVCHLSELQYYHIYIILLTYTAHTFMFTASIPYFLIILFFFLLLFISPDIQHLLNCLTVTSGEISYCDVLTTSIEVLHWASLLSQFAKDYW